MYLIDSKLTSNQSNEPSLVLLELYSDNDDDILPQSTSLFSDVDSGNYRIRKVLDFP